MRAPRIDQEIVWIESSKPRFESDWVKVVLGRVVDFGNSDNVFGIVGVFDHKFPGH